MNGIFITDASGIFADHLTPDDTIVKGNKFYFGKIEKDFPPINEPKYDLRCNRILKYLVDKLDLTGFEKNEIGIVIGTTNSGIGEFETTDNKHHAELGNPAEFLKWYLGTTNYAAGVSTACTSGIKAFSTAVKLLENNVCKAVIAGGVDTIAPMPSYGFHALKVLSHGKTNPFSKNRSGISLGEGGALFLLTQPDKLSHRPLGERGSNSDELNITPPLHFPSLKERGLETDNPEQNEFNILKESTSIQILGIGETSDAYHSATPDPEGTQAAIAIQGALDEAGLKADDIDYINLHGTGTVSNDIMEANAIYKIFGDKIPASSTKPLTGHCLGAAASVEAYICFEILKGKRALPIHEYDGEYDETLPKINLVNKDTPQKNINTCMCTSFGFGGTNAVVILGKHSPSSGSATFSRGRGSRLFPSLENVLPHDRPMILIDNILEVDMDKKFVKASVTINKDKIFFDKEINGISPLAGIEFMAQTIGCYAYYKAGQTIPKIGFLLGTRLYENKLEKFENGKTYTITAQEIYGDNELVSFECLIYNENEEVAKASVNAFQPKDAKAYLEEL